MTFSLSSWWLQLQIDVLFFKKSTAPWLRRSWPWLTATPHRSPRPRNKWPPGGRSVIGIPRSNGGHVDGIDQNSDAGICWDDWWKFHDHWLVLMKILFIMKKGEFLWRIRESKLWLLVIFFGKAMNLGTPILETAGCSDSVRINHKGYDPKWLWLT